MRIVSSVIGMSSVISRLPVGPNARGPPKGQPSTPYAQPVEVGAFSRDRAGGVHYDRRALRAYREPRLPSPLSAGFSDFVPKRNDLAASEAALVAACVESNLQPDFNVRLCDGFDARPSSMLRELDESNRFVQKSAESTSI